MGKIKLLLGASLLLFGSVANASIIYTDRATFEATHSSWIIDDYQNPLYHAGDVFDGEMTDRLTDARMTEISGTTTYRTTFRPDVNAVARYMEFHHDGTPALDRYYCGGCNAPFELSWPDLSINAVGIDIGSNYNHGPFWAFVEYADGSMEDWALPIEERARITHSFWGITSAIDILSIHFKQPGDIRLGGSFTIDNLTIGGEFKQTSNVPTPAAIWLFGVGLIGLVGFSKRRKSV